MPCASAPKHLGGLHWTHSSLFLCFLHRGAPDWEGSHQSQVEGTIITVITLITPLTLLAALFADTASWPPLLQELLWTPGYRPHILHQTGSFCPRGGTSHLLSLTFTMSIAIHFSSLSRSLWKAALPPRVLPASPTSYLPQTCHVPHRNYIFPVRIKAERQKACWLDHRFCRCSSGRSCNSSLWISPKPKDNMRTQGTVIDSHLELGPCFFILS